MSAYNPHNPLIVQSDRTLLLEVAGPLYEECREAIATFAELGYRNVEVTAWHGLFAPKGTPPEVVKALNGHFNEILKMQDVVAKMAILGALPLGGTPETLARTNAADFERFGKVIKELGIQAD